MSRTSPAFQRIYGAINQKEKMKKLLTAVSPFLLSGLAFAEGAGTAISIDTQPAKDIVDGVKNWVDNVNPLVLTVVGSFLAIWAIKFVVGIVKGMGRTAK